jgi:hypothetical protein
VGPELEPEAPDRLLLINGRVTQLVCTSALADEAEVPLSQWQAPATAPQLLLLALVDEEHGVVTFPGVLAASKFVDEVRQSNTDAAPLVELPLEQFGGGLERLLHWVTLLSAEAIPRVGFKDSAPELPADLLSRIQGWVRKTLAALASPPQPAFALMVGAARSAGRPADEVRLINPLVEVDAQGVAKAIAVCPTPTLLAEGPLAEVQIWRGEELLWRQQATSNRPIEGPIAWPLRPMDLEDRFIIRLRPYGAPVGSNACIIIGIFGNEDPVENETRIRECLNDMPQTLAEIEVGRSSLNSLVTRELLARLLENKLLQLPRAEKQEI